MGTPPGLSSSLGPGFPTCIQGDGFSGISKPKCVVLRALGGGRLPCGKGTWKGGLERVGAVPMGSKALRQHCVPLPEFHQGNTGSGDKGRWRKEVGLGLWDSVEVEGVEEGVVA